MTKYDINKEKRKSIPLSTSESLTFFFIPFRFFGFIKFKTNDFNESEIDRFKEYGFDLKIKQAKELILFGKLFYLGLTMVIIYILK